MTKPRTSVGRELFGILGSLSNTSEELSYWNRLFEDRGMDAFMDRYPTTIETLPERLSEMFHFDRRGYIVSEKLQEVILPLLDHLDSSVNDHIDTVVNSGGVYTGYFFDNSREKRSAVFLT